MATPSRAEPCPPRAAERLVHAAVFKATWSFAWNAVGRHVRTDDEREELAQRVVIKAWRNRDQYDGERGNVEQWLSGIAEHEAIDFLRERRRGPVLVRAGDSPIDAQREAPAPEGEVFLSLVAERALSFLPAAQRRVVILHEMEDRSFAEIAEKERISQVTAKARHKKGMAALRRAATEGKIDNPFAASAVALGLLGVTGVWANPPPEGVERAWQRARALLDKDPPESRRQPIGFAWRHRMGPALLLLLGAGPAVDGPGDSPCDAPPTLTLAASPATSTGGAVVESKAMGSTAVTPPHPAPSTPPAPVQSRQPHRGNQEAERAAFDEALEALRRGDLRAAADALTRHGRQFPRGELAQARAGAWSQVCARYRTDPSHGEVPEIERHCAGR